MAYFYIIQPLCFLIGALCPFTSKVIADVCVLIAILIIVWELLL